MREYLHEFLKTSSRTGCLIDPLPCLSFHPRENPALKARAKERDMVMLGQQLEKMLASLKLKLKAMKVKNKAYVKIDKTESMRIEIQSRKAQKLIAENLKIADSPRKRSYAF